MIDCVLLPESRSSSSVGVFYHLPAIQTLLVCLCVYICAICSLKMADDECRANLYHPCSTAATAPASTLQGKNKHAHTQVLAQHYYPLNLTCPLNSISLFIYSKWCVAPCLSTSLPLSLSVFSLPLQIAPVEIDESYDEMKQDARTCLSLMSQGLLYPEHIPLVLAALEEVICTHKSRNTRKSTHSQLPHLPAVNVPSLISQGIVLD